VKRVQRGQIILLSAERLPVFEIAKRVSIGRPMVWRWQQRLAREGIEPQPTFISGPPRRLPSPGAGSSMLFEAISRSTTAARAFEAHVFSAAKPVSQ
jgi:hypothetical protein